ERQHPSECGFALLPGGLNVGFETPHPCSELIIVAGLDAADGAIDVLGARQGPDAGQSGVILRLAPTVADVGAPIHARPGVHGKRSGGRRRVGWPRIHVRSLRRSRREHNKSGGERAFSSWIPWSDVASPSTSRCANVFPGSNSNVASWRSDDAGVRIGPES